MAVAATSELGPTLGASQTAYGGRWGTMPSKRPTDTFSARLRSYRRLRGFTQSDLAEKAGTDKGHIGKMETQADYEPSRDLVRRLAHALGIRPWDLEDHDFRPDEADPLTDAIAAIYVLPNVSEDEKRAIEVLLRRLTNRQAV